MRICTSTVLAKYGRSNKFPFNNNHKLSSQRNTAQYNRILKQQASPNIYGGSHKIKLNYLLTVFIILTSNSLHTLHTFLASTISVLNNEKQPDDESPNARRFSNKKPAIRPSQLSRLLPVA